MAKNVVWGSYSGYSGPMVLGRIGFVVGPNDDPMRKLMGVAPATEGGHYGDINGYDRCGFSLGLLQACAATSPTTSLACKLLGQIEQASSVPLRGALRWFEQERGMVFKRSPNGTWAFYRGGVEIPPLQLPVAWWGCSGRPDAWTPKLKAEVSAGALMLSDALEDPLALQPQVTWIANNLLGFVDKDVVAILFSNGLEASGWKGALQAAYVSFAANLPAVAKKHFLKAVADFGSPSLSNPDFVRRAVWQMTYGPQIAIYPKRAADIAVYIQRVYGVDILGGAPSTPPKARVYSVKEVQQRLLDLGYDLGPAGADGKFGRKSEEAVRAFQKASGLGVDGIVGPRTTAALFG